ncbi:MAG: response regulator [Planctomycetes bacterium]|nr:response regulator [Planctomycetota bacterium]
MTSVVPAKSKTPYSVLITDDDEGCRTSLQAILEPDGYRTYLASNGFEALQVIRREYIHVAILDVNMPGMSGLETWQRIKEESRRDFPCVFITGDSWHATRLQSLEEPAFVVVTKPLTKERVIRALESILWVFFQRGS